MIKTKYLSTLLLLILFACHEQPEIKSSQERPKENIRITTLNEAIFLKDVLNLTGFTQTTENTFTDKSGVIINGNEIHVITRPTGFNSFTFRVPSETKSNSFTNLILEQVKDGFVGSYMIYDFEKEITSLNQFTGTLTTKTLTNKVISVMHYSNGNLKSIEEISGRIKECAKTVTIVLDCEDAGASETTGLDKDWYDSNCVTKIKVKYTGECTLSSGGGGMWGGGSMSWGWSNQQEVVPFYEGNITSSFYGTPYTGPVDGGEQYSNCADPNGCPPPNEPVATLIVPPTKEEIMNKWNEEIDLTELDPCMWPVFIRIHSLTQGNAAKIINTFTNNLAGFNWKVTSGTTPQTNGDNIIITNAQTIVAYDNAECEVTTKFDVSKFKDASDLSIARSILHEAIHAYMVSLMGSDNLGFLDDRFGDMIIDYKAHKSGSDLNVYHHKEIALEFIDQLALALAEFDNNRFSMQFYYDLSWGGLTHTRDSNGNTIESPWFVLAHPNEWERARILNVISIENSKKTWPEGAPTSQKGHSTNCK